MYQKQLRVWVACLVSPFCHFKGAKLYICHLARDQCFKLEFPKETEHDFEGGVFENCLTMSLFNVQFDHLTMERVLLGIWQGFIKKEMFCNCTPKCMSISVTGQPLQQLFLRLLELPVNVYLSEWYTNTGFHTVQACE